MAFDLSKNEDFQRLFLLELLVDSVRFDYKKVDLSKTTLDLLKQTCVRFNFLDFPVIEVCEEDFCTTQGNYNIASDIVFRNGKSCFFSLRGLSQKTQCLKLGVTIVRQKDEPPPIIMGTTCITLGKGFVDVLNDINHVNETGEASNSLKDVFPIIDNKGIKIGSLALLIRLSCFGKAIITHFKIPQEKEAGYMFANTNEPERQINPTAAQMRTPISLDYTVPNDQVSPGDNNIFYPGINSAASPRTGIPETVLGSTPMGESYDKESASKTSPMIYRGFQNSTPSSPRSPAKLSGTAPGNFPGAAPGNFPGAAPGNFPGAAQGNFPGAAQGNFSGAAQGNFPGAAQGNFPGAAQGTFPGAAPFTFPGVAQDTFSGAAPVMYPQAVPGTFPGTVPGTFPEAVAGNFPEAAAGNFPGAAIGYFPGVTQNIFYGAASNTFPVTVPGTFPADAIGGVSIGLQGTYPGFMPNSEIASWGTTSIPNEGLLGGFHMPSMVSVGDPGMTSYKPAFPPYLPTYPSEIGMEIGMPQYSSTNLLKNATECNIDNNIKNSYKELAVSINGHEFTINILRKSRPKKEKTQPLQFCGRIPEIENSDSDESIEEESNGEVEEEYREKGDDEKDEEVPKIQESNTIKKERKKNKTNVPEPLPLITPTMQQNNEIRLCECDIALPIGFRLPEPSADIKQPLLATPPTPPPSPTDKLPQTQVDSPPQSASNHAINKPVSPPPPIVLNPAVKEKGKTVKAKKKKEEAPKNIYCLQPDCPMGFPWPSNIPQRKKIIKVPCCSQLPMHPGCIGLKGDQIVFQLPNETPDLAYYQSMLNSKNGNKDPYVLKLGCTNQSKCKCTKMILELPVPKLKIQKIERDDQDTQYLESDIPFQETAKTEEGKKKGKGKTKGQGKKGGKKGKKK